MNPESFFGNTDTGKQRTNNEDAFIASNLKEDWILACVIDGVGGYEGGEIAAAIAKDTIMERMSRATEPTSQIRESLLLANQRIVEARSQNPDYGHMSCVLTLALVNTSNNELQYAHVGDTRLYLMRDHSLVKLTRDQSFVGFLEDNKRISEEEAMHHPKRNEINKALGFDPNMASISDYIETGASPFLPGDLLMLCSDGLTDLVDNRRMTDILSKEGSLEQKTNALISAANDAGGKDNITVVLVQNLKKPKSQKATRPKQLKKKSDPEIVRDQDLEDQATIQPSVKKTSRSLLFFIILLCLALPAFLTWNFFFKEHKTQPSSITPTTVAPPPNPEEQELIFGINRPGSALWSDSVKDKVVTISHSILIKKDSLQVKGNDLVLRSDSMLKGPGLILDTSCKYILLEGIVFDHFNPAILARSHVLHLKNVRFNNCPITVQYDFHFAEGSYINGKLTDSLIFRKDSLPKK